MTSRGSNVFGNGARWTNKLEILFIDLMHEEVLRGNLFSSTFTPSVWKDIRNNMERISSYYFNVKQLREKLTRIKMHWSKFKQVMLADSGLGWDSERELPTASDAWWDIWEEAHPLHIGLRNKPCRRYLKLCTLFDRNTATGVRARSSSQVPPPHSVVDLDFGHDATPIQIDEPEDAQFNYMQWPNIPTPSTAGSSKRRKSQINGWDRLIASWESQTVSMNSRLKESLKSREEANSKQCGEAIDAARALPGVTVNDIVAAAKFFTTPDNRSIFLHLNPIEQKELLNSLPR